MIRPLRTLIIVAVVAAAGSVSDSASAQYGGGGFPFANAYGLYPNFYIDQRPPYFAQFPPVYYKHPIIARSYGQSPFPYPPCGCDCSGTIEEILPTTVRNPYVTPSKNDETDLKEAAVTRETSTEASPVPQPLRIQNPYYKAPAREASTPGDRTAQVIFPVARFAAK